MRKVIGRKFKAYGAFNYPFWNEVVGYDFSTAWGLLSQTARKGWIHAHCLNKYSWKVWQFCNRNYCDIFLRRKVAIQLVAQFGENIGVFRKQVDRSGQGSGDSFGAGWEDNKSAALDSISPSDIALSSLWRNDITPKVRSCRILANC